MSQMHLDRPLFFFDLETTGTDPAKDRIVEFAYRKVMPDLSEKAASRLVNPGIPIPIEASEVHHITDEMVKDQPLFRQVAKSLYAELAGCDLAGYNILNFDVPLLWEEFYRAGIEWDLDGVRIVDSYAIWQKLQPRKLLNAAREFAPDYPIDETALHEAGADVLAVTEVLRGQCARYPDVLRSIDECATFANRTARINGEEMELLDLAGALAIRGDGEIVYTHKRVKGVRVVDDRGYGAWLLKNDFPENTKRYVAELLGIPRAAAARVA
jgi:DNA polymerase III subunit epsilon